MTIIRNVIQALYAGSILMSLLSVTGDARAQDSTVVTNLRVVQQDAPVQILGIKLPESSQRQSGQYEPLVHLRNTSQNKTSRIWVQAIVTDAKGHVTRTNSNSPNNLSPFERVVLPGDEGWARETVLRSDNLLRAAKRLRSNCISVDVLVMRVDFADGTSWRVDGNKALAAARQPERIDGSVGCSDATASEVEIASLTSVQFRTDQEFTRPQDSPEVQSYSFTCSLHSEKGQTVGSCPF